MSKLLLDVSETMVNRNGDNDNACLKNTLLIKTEKVPIVS